MGKKKRKHADIEEVLARTWCYYCERAFEDLKLLISHQKAKHFKCDRCGRRLNTAGGLSVHMNQVHKETLQQVENALPARRGLDVEIFGMEGIPQDILDQHRNRIIQNFYQNQEERRVATGNPPPGQGGQHAKKNIKIETKEELLSRLQEWRAMKAAERGAVKNVAEDGTAPVTTTTTKPADPYQQPQQGFEQTGYKEQAQPGQILYPYNGRSSSAQPPGTMGPPPGLPQRPTGDSHRNASASVQDDIENIIRAAEASVKSGQVPEDGGEEDKKPKKEKKGRLIYEDADISPEERMVAISRYAFKLEALAWAT